MNNRSRGFFACLLPTIVCLALQNGAMIFGAQLYLLKVFLHTDDTPAADITSSYIKGISSGGFLMGVSTVYAIVGCLIFYLWYRGLNDKGRDSFRGYPLYLYGGIVVFAIGAQFVSAYIMTILSQARPDWLSDYAKLMENLDFSGEGWDILTVLYTVLLGPICEELCFRGLTMRLALRNVGPYYANTIQAFLFGGMHANPLQFSYAFVYGWILGLIYQKTDNLFITIAAHICYNAIAMSVGKYIGTGSTPVSFYCILLISLMAAYGGILIILKAQEKLKEKEANQNS